MPKSKARRTSRSRIAGLVVALACLATALASAGCGASGVIDPVAKAATNSTGAAGFRMTMTMQMSSPALPSAITATGSGAFNVRGRTGSLDLQMQLPNVPQITQALGSNTLSMREIMSGTTIYMRMPAAIASHLPGGHPWFKIDLAKFGASAGMPGLGSVMSSPLSSDPSQMLQYLHGVSGGVTKVGTATVAGFPTTEYRATIDLDKVASQVPANARAAVQRSIQTLESMAHIKQIPFDVWVDNSNLVRQFAMHMNVAVATGQAMSMTMQVTIPQYGPQPKPTLPPAGQVTDLSSLAGAASASGSASSTS
jgi:hypothetical protein